MPFSCFQALHLKIHATLFPYYRGLGCITSPPAPKNHFKRPISTTQLSVTFWEEAVTYQKKSCVCLAKALTKRNPFFWPPPKTYRLRFFFCCRAVMRITRLCGRTLLINASTFILFFGTITIFRFSILRIA